MERIALRKPPPPAGSYLGIPFKDGADGGDDGDRNGCSCHGLIRLWYKEQYGMILPVYTNNYNGSSDTEHIHDAIARAIADEWIETKHPKRGDVIITTSGKANAHIGIVLGEDDMFLHIRIGHDVSGEHWQSIRWRNQIAGYYRHRDRPVS